MLDMRAKPCMNLRNIPKDTEDSDLGQVKFRRTNLELGFDFDISLKGLLSAQAPAKITAHC